MSSFIKLVEQAPKNGVVDVKTYEAIRRALFEKLVFGIIRSQGMGDVLMCVPVVEALKRRNPASVIIFYSFPQYLPLLKRFDFIDKLGTLEEIDTSAIIVDLMGKVDFLPYCREAHRVELLADEAGIPRGEVNYHFSFSPTLEEMDWAYNLLHSHGISEKDKIIGIHLKSYANIRTWDGNWELIRTFLRRLSKKYKILLFEKDFVAVPKDIRSERVINLTGIPTIAQLVPLVAACSLLVCPDSGLMHLAGMLRIPFIALFGSIDPDFRIRYYPTGEAIWMKDDISCSPCWDWQITACKAPADRFKRCMLDITPEMVFDRVRRRL